MSRFVRCVARVGFRRLLLLLLLLLLLVLRSVASSRWVFPALGMTTRALQNTETTWWPLFSPRRSCLVC
jgi:hypothetical protein